MVNINTVKKLWKNDRRGFFYACFEYIVSTGVTNIIPDKEFLQLEYMLRFGKKIDFENPTTFNEKLQWLKIYNRNPEYSMLVDKASVKEWVSEKIGTEYVIPTIGVWARSSDIPYDDMPEKFVLKCTHDSGSVVVCKDKCRFDREYASQRLDKACKRNMFWWGREWPYKNVEPRIIGEKYMEDLDDGNGELTDYKFMCFNGVVKCIFTCTERFSEGLKVTFFDRDWNKMPFERHYPSSRVLIHKPKNLERMIELAEILSAGIPFVRVDFYEANNNIYFGEMTFFPGNGMEEFSPAEWDGILGSWIQLPTKRNK